MTVRPGTFPYITPATAWPALVFTCTDYGLSSIKPNDADDELDGGQEVARGLLVAGGDRAKLLDLGEEVLDQMALAMVDRSGNK